MRQWLAERGYDPKFGARPLNRLITTQIGNGLADKIIRGAIKMGDNVNVSLNQDKSGITIRSHHDAETELGQEKGTAA